MERILEYHEIPDHKRVKLVAIKLKGRASIWCKQFQMQRVRMGKRDSRMAQDEESLGEAVSTFQLHAVSLKEFA